IDKRKMNSIVTEFLFLGLLPEPETQLILFVIFLFFYLLMVTGNIIIIAVISIDMAGEKKTISFSSFAAQTLFFLPFGVTECVQGLQVMVSDHYVAICHPLYYTVIVNQSTCVQLVAVSWCSIYLSAMVIHVCTLTLPHCGPNVLNHFFCEVPVVLRLACTDRSLTELVVFICSIVNVFVSLSLSSSLLSPMPTFCCQHKTLSTWVSHLTVVALFYGTAIFMYMRPQSNSSQAECKIIAVFYIVVTPMLNPLIYSLRNQDVKRALKRALTKQRV
uniref:G-protein coupled receptors family 1 profile domain-containing protein n=1 Tax=Cavia porcellus TaxID=10141 RepID=A0A286XCK9_CAVPO